MRYNIANTNPRGVSAPEGVTKVHGGTLMNNILSQKQCTKCGKLKDKREFVKDPQKKDGLYSSCKQCYRVGYYSNHEKHIDRCKRYKTENREKVLAQKKKYYTENREVELKKMAERHKNKAEEEREYRRKNKEKLKVASAAWALLNRERKNLTLRIWRANNPEKRRAQKSNRRARERGSGGRVTAQEWKDLKEKYSYTCLCCMKCEPEIKLTQDHILPVVLGGRHSIDNIQPLCRSCNSRKNKKYIDYRPRFIVAGTE